MFVFFWINLVVFDPVCRVFDPGATFEHVDLASRFILPQLDPKTVKSVLQNCDFRYL